MNTNTFFERNVKINFDELPEVIRKQYEFLPGVDASVSVEGLTKIVDYPNVVGILLYIAKLLGIDLPIKGQNIPTSLSRWSASEDKVHTFWERRFQYPGDKEVILRSRFQPTAEGALEEFKYGVIFAMIISPIANGIAFHSERLSVKILGVKLTIPEILSLGKLSVIQKALNADSYQLIFEFVHPLFKRTYYFEGTYKLIES